MIFFTSICDAGATNCKYRRAELDIQLAIPSTLSVCGMENKMKIHMYNTKIKRIIDIIGAGSAILIFMPLMLIIALLIKMTSKGPVIFRQERVGLNDKNFVMYKFRTMKLQNPEEEKRLWTRKGDPRVTPIGKILRRLSMDELPQLLNVLRGDMSLVGPRPERPYFVEKFKKQIPGYTVKQKVLPGLTGWAQINGYRGDTSIRKYGLI